MNMKKIIIAGFIISTIFGKASVVAGVPPMTLDLVKAGVVVAAGSAGAGVGCTLGAQKGAVLGATLGAVAGPVVGVLGGTAGAAVGGVVGAVSGYTFLVVLKAFYSEIKGKY